MKFKLLEYSNTNKITDLTDKQAIKLMNTTYSQATAAQPIYRGIDMVIERMALLVTDPNNSRPSANTYNYYTLIINNSPFWEKFPKREIICTTRFTTAEGYGEPYIVYPKNGAKIGICPQEDIWVENFDTYNHGLDDMFAHFIGLNLKFKRDKNYKSFIKVCKYIDTHKNELKKDKSLLSRTMGIYKIPLNEYFFSNIPFIDFLGSIIYSPKKFKVTTIDKFEVSGEHEVWTDAPCLLRPISYEI